MPLETLKQCERTIADEVPYVDLKPYSHNIISLTLRHIGQTWGKEEANKIIDKYKLTRLGWRKE